MKLEADRGIAVLRMDAGKANAINPAMLAGLDGALDRFLESDARAMVLTGTGRAFSAGLDLRTLCALDRDAMRAFMQEFERVFLRVFLCPRPVAAAINGHAIAGGCVLALQADHRLAADDARVRIGLNETALAVGLPAIVVETARVRLAPEAFLVGLVSGALHDPPAARALGLVDEAVPAAELLDRALAHARRLAEIPARAYAQTKAALRAPAAERVAATGAAVLDTWLDTWFSDEARRRIGETIARLEAGRGS
jgi:enoyl-CoA hydratase